MKTALPCEFGYIINSLLDTDFYKFTMGQFIFKHFRGTEVEFSFMNRTGVPLARYIKEADLRRELDHFNSLRFNTSEIAYLRGLNVYKERMFSEEYLAFLKDLHPQEYSLKYRGDIIDLRVKGPWERGTYCEVPYLAIVNELYYRALLSEMTPFQRELVYAEGNIRHGRKLDILKQNPQVIFSDFGTRRRFSRDWQHHVVSIDAQELDPKQFIGTSNVLLAWLLGVEPKGTNAHEPQMVMAGLAGDDDDALAASPHKFLDMWWDEYGEGLSVILADTFGSDYMLRTISRENLRRYKTVRLDSGNLGKEGEQWIVKWEDDGTIDLRSRLLLPSDGLTVHKMCELTDCFSQRTRVGHGIGTNKTNDLGLDPLSIVMKPTLANGRPLVKLSNNLAKAMGPAREAQRYKRVFGYTNRSRQKTVY